MRVFCRYLAVGSRHCCAEGHAHNTGLCAPLSSLGSGPVQYGVLGTFCPIDPGSGESFQFFKFSWTVLLLSGPNTEPRCAAHSPFIGRGVWNGVYTTTLLQVVMGWAHVSDGS